jgi:hypothetical protein
MAEARAVAFSTAATSTATAGDTVETRSFGPNCGAAVLALVVRAANQAPIYAFAAPASSVFPDAPGDAESLARLLRRWGDLAVATTADPPAWATVAGDARAPALPPADLQPPWSSPFDATTFADIRARALPMACYQTSPDSAECLYWEPAAGQALVFLRFQR